MERKIYIKSITFLLLLLIISCHSVAKAEKKNVVLDELLTEVQKTLIRVRDSIEEEDLPALNNITLNLKSSLVVMAEGKVSLFIIEFGANVSREAVQEIKLELKPPKPADAAKVSAINDTLATAIIEASKSAKKAETRNPPLHLSKLTATIRFVVKKEGDGGVKFTLVPVTVGLGGQVTDVATQEIIIEFGK